MYFTKQNRPVHGGQNSIRLHSDAAEAMIQRRLSSSAAPANRSRAYSSDHGYASGGLSNWAADPRLRLHPALRRKQ